MSEAKLMKYTSPEWIIAEFHKDFDVLITLSNEEPLSRNLA